VNKLGLFIYFAWIVGVILIVYNLGFTVYRRRRIREVFKEDQHKEVLYILYKNKKIRSFKEYIEERANFAGTRWRVETFLSYSLFGGIIGVVIAIKYLKNPMTIVPLFVASGLIPRLYLSYFILRKEALLEQQLIPAIQYFISEYSSLPNIISALSNILPMIEYPLEGEINRLIIEINSGRKPEKAFFSFAERINSRWAYRLAHILNLRMQKGINVNTMLFNLYMDMKTKVVKDRERRSETAAARAESLILYLCIPVVYFMATKISPESHYLLTQTSMGKKAMFAVIILVLFGLFTTFKLGISKTE
jgi:Flp pilus assembly protein TadB